MDNIIVGLLKELITEYNRVSLPCLGSFLAEHKSAFVADGKIYPPSKSIVFLQNEIWNDEKLEKSLAVRINESIGAAKEKIAFWIDNICLLLATGEDVILPGLGKLYISDMSKLMFEQQSENLLPDSFGLEAIELPEISADKRNSIFANNDSEKTAGIGKSLIIGMLFIIILAILAGYAIVKYILMDSLAEY